MKQFVLDFLDKACDSADHVAACRHNLKGADLHIDLNSGKSVAVYIINRAIRLSEILDTFEQNSKRKLYTLYVVDGRMMPENNAQVEPPHWMAALHALGCGRVYAYWCDGRRTTIRPVHMEWKWGGDPRSVEYGPEIDMKNLRVQMVDCASKYITGYYAMADFNDASFWKKQDPVDYRERKYSWREWSYGQQRPKPEEPAAKEKAWDPWEEFARQYGSAGENASTWKKTRRQKRQRETVGHTYTVQSKDYAILGVTATASFDEIKQAYRRKAREYHPDLHPTDKEQYTAKMADINAAFEAISRTMKH